jgi:hypothetical protein
MAYSEENLRVMEIEHLLVSGHSEQEMCVTTWILLYVSF